MEKPLALVIEDDKNLALAFAEALSDAGYQTEVIHDGQTALDRLAETIPVTVVLDLHIPLVNGMEVLKVINEDERLAKITVIVATADDRTAEIIGKRANLVLLKPIGYQQLRELSARFMRKGSKAPD